MRLAKLILHAFGHFSEKSFDFGQKQPSKSDFHIFYGPNEAGKTTIMEAWLRLLFGIPKNEKYSFRQQRKNLKIAAMLDVDGHEQYFARLPQGHGSVLQNESGAVVGEAALASYLHGLDELSYRNLLCLNEDTLEKGGQDIMESKGDMGRLLFAAAAGLADFSALLDEKRAKADELYKPNGRVTQLAELGRRYDELSKRIADLDISAADYQELKEKAENARCEEERLKTEKRAIYDKVTLLRQIIAAQKLLQAQEKEFAAAVESLCQCAANLGMNDCHFQISETPALYRWLKKLSLSEAQRNALEQKQQNAQNSAREINQLKQNIAEAEQNYQQKQAECAALRTALPLDDAPHLGDILREFQAEDLAQDYKAAEAERKTLEQRFAQALADIAVKGQIFTDLPYAELTAEEADKIARRKAQAEAARAMQQEQKQELTLELADLTEELARLKNPEGYRL